MTRNIPPQPPMTDDMAGHYLDALAGELDEMRATARRINRLAAKNRPAIGQKGTCLDCGRPQHYTGTEAGWCHDATIDMLSCGASPALLAELEK